MSEVRLWSPRQKGWVVDKPGKFRRSSWGLKSDSVFGRPAILAIFFILLTAVPARAIYVRDLLRFDGSLNRVEFDVRAGVWRWAPTGETLIPGTDTNFSRRSRGEFVVGVFRANSVNGVSGFTGEFTGYFAVQILNVHFVFALSGLGPFATKVNADYLLGAAGNYDPFEVLAGDVGLVWYFDPQPNFPSSDGDFGQYVAAATDGDFFGSFRFGFAADKDAGGAPSLGAAASYWSILQPSKLELAGGLNVAELAPGLEYLVFTGVPSPLGGAVNSLSVRVTFEPGNPGPWPWKGTGVVEFRAVPEPHSLAVVGGLLLAAGLMRTCRSRKTEKLAPALLPGEDSGQLLHV